VMLLAEDSRARCPTICTGSPAATAGCRNGGSEAQREARDFTKTYGHERAREVLRSLAADPEAKFKIGPYFDGHVAERELPRTEQSVGHPARRAGSSTSSRVTSPSTGSFDQVAGAESPRPCDSRPASDSRSRRA